MKKILTLISVIYLILITSCLKKQNLEDDNLGLAITTNQLTRALSSGVGSYSLNEIKSNEFNSLIVSQRIQDGITQNLQQQGITIQKSINTPESLSLDLIAQKEDYTGGQTLQSTAQWSLVFDKTSTNTNMRPQEKAASEENSEPPILLFLLFQQLAFEYCHDSGEHPEACYQLVAEDIQYKVPITAASQHDCNDANNCFISAKKIQFDRIQKTKIDKDGKPRRTHYTIILSSEVPFLSRVLQMCTRSLYNLSNTNQKILADTCYTVNSYAFGR